MCSRREIPATFGMSEALPSLSIYLYVDIYISVSLSLYLSISFSSRSSVGWVTYSLARALLLTPALSIYMYIHSYISIYLYIFRTIVWVPGLGACGPRGPLLLGGLIARRPVRWPPLLCDRLDDFVGERL